MYRLVCAACQERVLDLDSIEFEGKSYHESCFVCHECNEVLSDAGEAQCIEGQIVCHQCSKGKSVPSLLRYLFPGQQNQTLDVQSPSPLRRSRGRRMNESESTLNEPIRRSYAKESKFESKWHPEPHQEAEFKIQRLERENDQLKEQYKKATEHYHCKIKALEQQLSTAQSALKKSPSDMADLELKRMQKETLESQVLFLQQQQASLRQYVHYAEQVIKEHSQLKEKHELLQKQVTYLQQTKKSYCPSHAEPTESIYPTLTFE